MHLGVVAGEDSGDALGARVLDAFAARGGELRVQGVGGERMQARGLHGLFPMERLSVMGLVEPLPRLPELLWRRGRLARHFLADRPDLFLGIDAPEFNLPLARRLRRARIPTAHLVSPSVWAWRPGRIDGVGRSVDRVLCLFPFEPPLYAARGVPARFVGHPLATELAGAEDRAAARRSLGLPAGGPQVALLPGSRVGEVRRLAPLFLEVARRLSRLRPDVSYLLPAANAACDAVLAPLLRAASDLTVTRLRGASIAAMSAADAVLVASGTAALEAALLQRPMVVAYRLGGLSARVLGRLLRTDYVALPNILAGRELVPELLQDAATPDALLRALLPLLDDPPPAQMLAGLAALRDNLRRDFGAEVCGALSELLAGRGTA